MRYIDCHTHVQFTAFKDDWKEVILRALSQNIWLINVGTQRDTSRRAVEATKEFAAGVYAIVGLHPIHTEKSFHDEKELGGPETSPGFISREEEFDYDYYKKLASAPKVVAIGECGLDYYIETGNITPEAKEKQQKAFIKQIELAKEVKRPLMLHCRDGKKSGTGRAFNDLVAILKSANLPVPFINHSFVRDLDLAKNLLEQGAYFSFNGLITFSGDYEGVIRYLPMDRILSETDSPYLAPAPHRGKRNEPAYVVEVVRKLAEIKNVSVEKMAEQLWENARRIFGI
jgi:TatD DNase family protein